MNIEVVPREMRVQGKVGLIISLLLVFILFVEGFVGYLDLSSNPKFIEDADIYLYSLSAMLIAPVILLLIFRYRYTLINKYPFLINIPAFYMKVARLPPEDRGYWVEKYFEALLYFNIPLTVYLIITYYAIYYNIVAGEMPLLMLILIVVIPIPMTIGFLAYIWRLHKQIPT